MAPKPETHNTTPPSADAVAPRNAMAGWRSLISGLAALAVLGVALHLWSKQHDAARVAEAQRQIKRELESEKAVSATAVSPPSAQQSPEHTTLQSAPNPAEPQESLNPSSLYSQDIPTEALQSDDPMARRKVVDMRAMDVNRDGYLVREEVRGAPHLPEAFDRVDSNLDGKISLREFLDFRPVVMSPLPN